jgi:hypothetical protein
MRRRELIALVGGAAVARPLAARAQQKALPVIGYLGISSPSLEPHYVEAFRQKLRELGHIEGENITIEYRWAEGQDDRLPDLAAELVRLRPAVIVTTGTPGTLAAKQATQTIPIVFASSGDPVWSGLVGSFSRPGGNATGFTVQGSEAEGKGLQFLKEAVPVLSRIAVLLNPANRFCPHKPPHRETGRCCLSHTTCWDGRFRLSASGRGRCPNRQPLIPGVAWPPCRTAHCRLLADRREAALALERFLTLGKEASSGVVIS